MLIRNYVGATAELVACLAYSVVKLVVLGTSEVFVKAADLLNNLTSVGGVKKAVEVLFLGWRTSVGGNRASEKRVLCGKQSKLPRRNVRGYVRSASADNVLALT